MDKKLINMLIAAREIAETPFRISSSIRCKAHNKASGGSPTSSHLVGEAVDILCDNSVDRYKIITSLLIAGFNRIGVGSSFIHADIDRLKHQEVFWVYA